MSVCLKHRHFIIMLFHVQQTNIIRRWNNESRTHLLGAYYDITNYAETAG